MTTPASNVNASRPRVLDHFVGQKSVVDRVRVALEAAWNDGTALPHMLFTGGPGLGKTQLAQILAQEMGTQLKEQLGQQLRWPVSMRAFLLSADDRDVLFIDECHEMNQQAQTLLYRAIEERQLHLFGQDGKSQTIDLSNFTLIAATTDQYCLLQPLLDRFRVIGHFTRYAADDLAQLLDQRCRLLGWSADRDVLEQVAARGRGTPRLALRLMESCWRTARAAGHDRVVLDHFKKTCVLEGIDDAGLDEAEQRYLQLLAEYIDGTRLNVLASRLDLPTQTLQANIEAPLIQEGFIEKSEVGLRRLTQRGRNHLAATNATNPSAKDDHAHA